MSSPCMGHWVCTFMSKELVKAGAVVSPKHAPPPQSQYWARRRLKNPYQSYVELRASYLGLNQITLMWVNMGAMNELRFQ